MTGNGRFNMFGLTSTNEASRRSDNSTNSHLGSGQTPQYVITCPNIFSSQLGQIDGADASADSTPCLTVDLRLMRQVTYDSSGQQSGDGAVVASNVTVTMKHGTWGPIVQQNLHEGKKIRSLSKLQAIMV
jgi:hypothetical protein